MKKIVLSVMMLGSVPVLQAATIVSGCVTDSAGRAVPGAKVFAISELMHDKLYRAEAGKSDGCYKLRIPGEGIYRLGVRDLRFDDDGPVQAEIAIPGAELQKVDLSTDVPNGKLLRERLTDGFLSASDGFSGVRSDRASSTGFPAIMAQIPSGFADCMLQFSNGQNGPTALWWCNTGLWFGIRDERDAHAMFESIRDSIGATLSDLGQLRYSASKDTHCSGDCVEFVAWESPINGLIAMHHLKIKGRNVLWLWAAYNSRLTEKGCEALQRHDEFKVDHSTYFSAVFAMRAEYDHQLVAAVKSGNRAQLPGVAGSSEVAPNKCLEEILKPAPAASQPKHFAPIPTPPAPTDSPVRP